MASIKSELSEVDKKLQELLAFYKNTPIKETITTVIEFFKGLDSSIPLKTSLKNTSIPSHISSILDTKNTVIHINVFELIYLYVVNDLYSITDISMMIENLTKHSWSQQYKLKILQMCFYFVRMNLPVEIFFKLISLVIESFVIEDYSMDLIARPIVSQIVEKILELSNKNIDYMNRLLQFLYMNVVYKKQYFLSYIFPIILKYPEIDKYSVFNEFINKEFVEMALIVVNNGESEEKAPIFESILKIERMFESISLDSFYENISIEVARCDLLLRFISFLIQIKANKGQDNNARHSISKQKVLPYSSNNKVSTCDNSNMLPYNNVKEILQKYFLEADFTYKNTGKSIRFFNHIVSNMLIEMDILFIIDIIFEKISKCKEESTGEVNKLYLNTLNFCIKNDLRTQFNNGVISGYNGNIKNINEILFDVKEYMRESWNIFFEFNSKDKLKEMAVVLSKIREFEQEDLKYFINALPYKNQFSLIIFEESKDMLRDSIDLFEVFLQKIEDLSVLFKIILEYYHHQVKNKVDPRSLKILISRIETFTDVCKEEVRSFLDCLMNSASLDDCWDEFFQLLKYSDGQIDIAIEIIKNHISEKNVKQLFESLKRLLEWNMELNLDDTILLEVFKDYFDFILKTDPENPLFTHIWTESLVFISEKIDTSENKKIDNLNISRVFLKILFNALLVNYENSDNAKIVFFNKIVFEKLYSIKNTEILRKSLEELKIFLERFLPRYDLEGVVSFLSTKVCDQYEDCTIIPQLSFENIRIISRKIKEIVNEKQVSMKLQENEPKVVLKYKGKKKKNQKSINFNNNSLISKEKDISLMKTDTSNNLIKNNNLMNQKAFSSSKIETHPLVSIIFQSFKTILNSCNPVHSEIILQVFFEIPSFIFNNQEISDLSEHLRKYIEMAEPFRTSALECFIKTCGVSRQFSFCLMILSSWLSKESREISLSLIDKIKENLVDESHNQKEESHKLSGLSYFLDYSLQFSQSDDFLEPVLDLVEKCGCSLDRRMIEKLIRFSSGFILSQIEIKYNETREEKLKEYIEFLFKTVITNIEGDCADKIDNEETINMFLDTLIKISNKKTYYIKLKMKCLEILFGTYKYSECVLKNELKLIFNDLTDSFTKQGIGISEYSMNEVRLILLLLIKSGNIELINSLKMELIELLLIRDHSLIDLVRILLKKMFLHDE